MKTSSFLHIGDIHIDSDPKFRLKVEASLNQIIEYCQNIKVNAIIIPGDIWHKRQSYSNSSGVPFFIVWLKKLSALVDFIFITKGNHDDPGSINLLHQLTSNIFSYEYPVCLGVREDTIVDLMRSEPHPELPIDYIVSLIPYPTKASMLMEDSIDNNNVNFIEKFEEIFELIGETTSKYNCPKILGAHLNVNGARLSTGQTIQSQDILVSPKTLKKAGADYYALNHIHLRQEIKPTMIYAGGIANFNWGEIEQKSFEALDFVNGYLNIETIPLTAARPMITVEAEFVNSDFKITNWDMKAFPFGLEPEVRFRCKVLENERNLITENNLAEVKREFGDDVKIEFNIVPVERESRSEQIMNCKTLLDEVKEYGAVINEPVNGTIEKKVATLQEGVAQ